eukprot:1391538-Rhodomonas_salina.3
MAGKSSCTDLNLKLKFDYPGTQKSRLVGFESRWDSSQRGIPTPEFKLRYPGTRVLISRVTGYPGYHYYQGHTVQL